MWWAVVVACPTFTFSIHRLVFLRAVTNHPEPAPKTFNFKLSPRNIGALRLAPAVFVVLALPSPRWSSNLQLFSLSSSSSSLRRTARFRFVSLANNHSLDYFEQGLLDTACILDATGINYAGVGRQPAAAAPAVVEEGGVRVAFLSYSDHYDSWAATKERIGINYINPAAYDRDAVEDQVQRAVGAADLLIVFIHWGPNWAWTPSK